MSSEGDVSSRSTGEVATVQANILDDWISAVTVLSDAPIHLVLNCNIDIGGLCL